MIEVMHATTQQQLDDLRGLIRAFVDWHRERHAADTALIDAYFNAKAFEEELAGLPGKYGPPGGLLLLASLDSRPAGCVALRALEADTAEMKRMFVRLEYQGKGVGRALSEALIREARAMGYSRMRLDTSVRQVEALTLYERMGFVRIDPYYDVAPALAKWLVFMELRLTD